jgi:hypothetical protein
MGKKPPRPANAPLVPPTRKEDDALDVPTLLWALGILAALIVIQRLIWGE